MSTVQESSLYGGYLKNVQRVYEREPLVQASLQLILSIFTVAFFVFAAIRPTLGTITTLLKKIDDQKIADQKLSTKIVQLAAAQEFLSTNGEEIGRLGKLAVPDSPEVKRLAAEIELSANDSGVLITSLNFQATPLVGAKSTLAETGPNKATSGEQFVTFSFSAGGTQSQLFDFLDRLEKLDRAVTLTNLIFTKPLTTGKLGLPLVVSGKATAYYLTTGK